jgi:hypothetical protein
MITTAIENANIDATLAPRKVKYCIVEKGKLLK